MDHCCRRMLVALSFVTTVAARSPAQTAPSADHVDDPVLPSEYVPLPPGARIVFNFDQANISELLRAIANLSGHAVVVSPDAATLADCTRVTIYSPRRVTVARAEQLFITSLRGSALRATIVRGVVHVTRDPAVAPPASCTNPPDVHHDNPYASTASPVPPVPPPPVETVLREIHEVSPTEHSITRSALDRLLENQADLMRTTRIMPVDQHGRTVGVRLLGVASPSVLFALGFRDGDVLSTLNDLDITSPDHALEAYSRLRSATVVTARVQRNGAPIDLVIRIQ